VELPFRFRVNAGVGTWFPDAGTGGISTDVDGQYLVIWHIMIGVIGLDPPTMNQQLVFNAQLYMDNTMLSNSEIVFKCRSTDDAGLFYSNECETFCAVQLTSLNILRITIKATIPGATNFTAVAIATMAIRSLP